MNTVETSTARGILLTDEINHHDSQLTVSIPPSSLYRAEIHQKRLRDSLQPSFALLNQLLHSVRRDDNANPKKILLTILRNYRSKCDMVIYFQRTVGSVINMQRFIQ